MGRGQPGRAVIGAGLLLACSPGPVPSGDDTETSTTSGAASQGPSGGPTGTTGGEVEDEGDFRVPRASGKFVYSASKTTDSVAVINSATLAIDVVGVGRGPTVVEPIPGQPGDAGAVVVLDQGSDDVALLRTSDAGATSVQIVPVTPGANNLAVAPDGAHALVYHDVDGPEQLGPGSDQELTVIALASGEAHGMTVGAHPREVVFASDHTRAWVITAAGVNVIRFDALGTGGKPPLVPVVSDPGLDPAKIEVLVSPAEGVALARVLGEASLAITDLQSGALQTIELPGSPTDLDLAPAGDFAALVIPGDPDSRFLELPLPLEGKFAEHVVTGEYVGQSALAPSGDAMLLFTTTSPFTLRRGAPEEIAAEGAAYGPGSSSGSSGGSGGSSSSSGPGGSSTGDEPTDPSEDPRRRLTLARRSGAVWDTVTLFVEDPVASVGVAPDSQSALLVHSATGGGPGAYSLFDLVPDFPLIKRQTTETRPGAVLFTPGGERAAVLLRDDELGVRKVDLVDLRSFIVRALPLGSPPEGAGYVDATKKLYLSQEHPSGRITFVDEAGAVQTVTGYVLNDSIKD